MIIKEDFSGRLKDPFKSIRIPKGYYSDQSAAYVNLQYTQKYEDTSESPPLSDIEIQDIIESSKEYQAGEQTVYENAEEFIESLKRERRKANNI